MRRSFAFLAGFLALAVSVAAIAVPHAVAQPLGEEVQPPLPVHPMKQVWRDIDQVNFEVDQIHIYTRYCKPPNGPNIADTQWEIDFVTLNYKRLQAQFDAFHAGYEQAIKSRMTAGYRSGFPPLDGVTADHRDYWAKISGMLRRLAGKIEAKQAALNKKKEVDCAEDDRQPPPPPPPPPADWLKGLEKPVAPPVAFAELPPHFCTELEKSQWIIENIHPPHIQAAENARFASYYVVAVGRRMRELEVKRIFEPLTADEQRGLKLLSDEYKWAQENLAEQDRVAAAINAHYAKANAIPIIDCTPEEQPISDPIPQPEYEMFVYPAVPPRFCSEAEKQAVLSHLDYAKSAARRNYEKAKAQVEALERRLNAGDKTPGLADALQQARQSATSYYNLGIELDRAYYKALAMPVEKCDGVIDDTADPDADQPDEVGAVPAPTPRTTGGPDFAAGAYYGRGDLQLTPGAVGGLENVVSLERINGILEGDDDDSRFRRFGADVEVLMQPKSAMWSPAAGLGAINIVNSVLFRAEFAEANLWRSTSFDPMGDTFFLQGFSDNLAETVALPATFDATVRDNIVDEFAHWGSYERQSLSLAFMSRGGLPDCENMQLSTRLGAMYEWSDLNNRFDVRVNDYFPIASPGFDIRATYNESIESSTIAATVGAGAKWHFSPDFYLAGNLAGRIGYSEAEAALHRRVDIDGTASSLFANIDDSEVTFATRARLAVGHPFNGGAVELGLSGIWANDHWIVNYAPGVPANLSNEERHESVLEFRTQFTW